MTGAIAFRFEGAEIRVVERDGEPWFVARDVATRLGYQDARKAVEAHCKGGVKCPLPTAGGVQEMILIPERDVYRLIMRSRLPNADAFEEWVVGEVLPSIRKTGAYVRPTIQVPRSLSEALRLAADQADQLEAQRSMLAVSVPKAAALDRIEGLDGSMCITNAAKVLKVAPKQLHDYLRQQGWTYRRASGQAVVGYQSRITCGLIEHKTTRLPRSDGPDKIVEQVLITAKGLSRLAQDMASAGKRREMIVSPQYSKAV